MVHNKSEQISSENSRETLWFSEKNCLEHPNRYFTEIFYWVPLLHLPFYSGKRSAPTRTKLIHTDMPANQSLASFKMIFSAVTFFHARTQTSFSFDVRCPRMSLFPL